MTCVEGQNESPGGKQTIVAQMNTGTRIPKVFDNQLYYLGLLNNSLIPSSLRPQPLAPSQFPPRDQS